MVALLVYPPSIECIVWLFVGIVHLGQGEHLLFKLCELTVHSPLHDLLNQWGKLAPSNNPSVASIAQARHELDVPHGLG